jgi:carboxyl-terminal processing protease
MKRVYPLFIVLVLYALNLRGYEQDLLKSSNIAQIMTQILDHHVEKKEMTEKVLQHSVVSFIDRFDPLRIYLLESEVSPYISPSPERMRLLIDQYKDHNFAVFHELNDLFQQAIERSRSMRRELEANKSTLFNFKNKQDALIVGGSMNELFAKNKNELKERLVANLDAFIETQRNRYSEAVVLEKKDEILQLYETGMREFESQYIYQDDKGAPLPLAERENLFTIHVLKALAGSLDAHTSFYKANEAYDLRVRLQKEIMGFGLVLKDNPEGVVVVDLLKDSPASLSGNISVGDILVEINGNPVSGYPFDKVMNILHDSSNPEMTLVFNRGGKGVSGNPFKVNLKREMIIVNNDRVDSSYENFGNGILGKIVLNSFYQGDDLSSEQDVRDAIKKLQGKGQLKGLILDLRNNSGGFLSQAIKVAGLFITNGVVVVSKYSNGEERIYRDVDGKIVYDGPLVILTSKITASAAEIVSQALQDYGVAIVVGDEHTYGKGTIQTQTVTDNQSSSYFKVTVGTYYTVSGKTPQKSGVKADIVVPGHWNNEHVGEEYLDSVRADRIAPAFNDNLSDISPDIKSWYLKYYIPKLQARKIEWRNMLSSLKKNSEYRIANNKNYQFYLKGGEGALAPDQAEVEVEDEDGMDSIDPKKKNFGVDDLQMQEAINILKDMVLMHSLASPVQSVKSTRGVEFKK